MIQQDDSMKLRFNMQGYLMEFDKKSHTWTWNKWESITASGGEKRIIRRSGGLEFMKVFRTLFKNNSKDDALPQIHSQEEMENALKKYGVEFVMLYQGNCMEEKEFIEVTDAEKHYGLCDIPSWDLTEYWFAFDNRLQSWAMFDTFTGGIEFTPVEAEQQLQKKKETKAVFPRLRPIIHPSANNRWN